MYVLKYLYSAVVKFGNPLENGPPGPPFPGKFGAPLLLLLHDFPMHVSYPVYIEPIL